MTLGNEVLEIESPADSKTVTRELGDCVIGVDHVAIAVRDLDAAVDWYTNLLGFRLMERRATRGRHTGMISAVLSSGTAVVVLIQGTEPASQVSRFVDAFGPGVQHMALLVDDLDRAVDRLTSRGGAVDTTIVEGQGLRQAFLRRDGSSAVRIELIERKGGTFSDRSVQQLFLDFEARDLY